MIENGANDTEAIEHAIELVGNSTKIGSTSGDINTATQILKSLSASRNGVQGAFVSDKELLVSTRLYLNRYLLPSSYLHVFHYIFLYLIIFLQY